MAMVVTVAATEMETAVVAETVANPL
jgi:hypothetical protein